MDKSPDQLLAEVSDELGRRIQAATGSLRSASPGLHVVPGFPFTLVRAEQPESSGVTGEALRPFPVIYELGVDEDGDYVQFYLGNPTTVNGDYPIKMPVTTARKQFYFLKVTATTDAVGVCTSEGPPPTWFSVYQDVVTDSVEIVVREGDALPEQENPTVASPCGDNVEGEGWSFGSLFGSPSGTYVIYLPLLCLDFTGDGPPVSHTDGASSQIAADNPMYITLRDSYYLAGDSARLWWSDGQPYSNSDVIPGGDPGALYIVGITPEVLDPEDPEDAEFVLRSL